MDPYLYVRHTWFNRVDVEKLAKDLSSSFEVVSLHRPEPPAWSITGGDSCEKFLVKADTLQVYLSPTLATLFQKYAKPFTRRDLNLREEIFFVYPHSRSSPWPWGFLNEPHFEVEKTKWP